MRLVITIVLVLLLGEVLYGQKNLKQLLNNKKFEWLTDTTAQLTIYYQKDSWTAKNLKSVREHVIGHIESTKSFMGIESYTSRIHLFIVENRGEMKELINRQTNGAAFPAYNILTGIASDKINSIYANHEIFHLMSMNLWGVPETWISEGMAVYSDGQWHGYELYPLTKYLVENKRYVPLSQLIKKFRHVDDLVSYPLLGSFVKYLDETYGREVVINIWKDRSKNIEKLTGKSLEALEAGWLNRIQGAEYGEIKY